MEDQLPSSPLALPARNRAKVDTSRPFSSVKEAIAVFGERLLAGDHHHDHLYVKAKPTAKVVDQNKPMPVTMIHSTSYSPASQLVQDDDDHEFMFPISLKKLESELEQTRRELMLLKEREAKTEMAVMDLSAQLQRSISMLAEIESVNTSSRSIDHDINLQAIEDEEVGRIRSCRWQPEESLPTLAQALRVNGDEEDELSGRRRRRRRRMIVKVAKRKPIIPLIGDLFSKKKGSDDLSSSYYCRSIYSMLS